MTIQPGNMSYVQSFGSSPNAVAYPHIEDRDPAESDVNFPIGKRWTNKLDNNVWELTSFDSSSGVLTAHWEQLN